MNRWQGIEEFVKSVETGSFSAAAEALQVSKSHISKQVGRLEQRLGVRLLHRTTRKLKLTEIGRSYFRQCQELLHSLDAAEQSVSAQQISPKGSILMTVAGVFGERYLAPAVARFLQKYPDLKVEIDFTNRQVDLLEEGYDLAIRAGRIPDSSLIGRKLLDRRLYVCASPDYLARYGVPQTPEALKRHNCLLGTLPHWQFAGERGARAVKVQGNWRSNNGHALVAAALAGLGLVQLPSFYVEDKLASGELVEVLAAWQPSDSAIWALYPSRRFLPVRVRLLVEFLVDYFADGVAHAAPVAGATSAGYTD